MRPSLRVFFPWLAAFAVTALALLWWLSGPWKANPHSGTALAAQPAARAGLTQAVELLPTGQTATLPLLEPAQVSARDFLRDYPDGALILAELEGRGFPLDQLPAPVDLDVVWAQLVDNFRLSPETRADLMAAYVGWDPLWTAEQILESLDMANGKEGLAAQELHAIAEPFNRRLEQLAMDCIPAEEEARLTALSNGDWVVAPYCLPRELVERRLSAVPADEVFSFATQTHQGWCAHVFMTKQAHPRFWELSESLARTAAERHAALKAWVREQ